VNFYRNSQNKYNLRSLSRKKSRNLLRAGASMSHGHILLLFQGVALLTFYSDKYHYKITISYPYNLHFRVHPQFLSLSLSLSLLNSHISKLTSCNFSPLINTPISVMIFTHFSINLAMSIKKQPIYIYQLKWLLKLKINKCTLYLCASQVKLLNDFCYSYTPMPTRLFGEIFYTSAHMYTMH
jgi:hypothetical protein